MTNKIIRKLEMLKKILNSQNDRHIIYNTFPHTYNELTDTYIIDYFITQLSEKRKHSFSENYYITNFLKDANHIYKLYKEKES